MPVKEVIKLNRKVITFLICVLASCFFWLMMTLSKQYTIIINFPVRYINFPVDKVVANQLPENIDIEIESNGFNLMLYKIRKRNDEILMDVKDAKPLPAKNHFYLCSNSRMDKITSQFNSEINIVRLFPDTVFLNFNKKVTKRVPVKANLKLTFQNQFQQKDSVLLTPNFIEVSGAADVIQKINEVETVPMEFNNVNKPLSFKLDIFKTNELKFVQLSQNAIHGVVNVTKFTEASILIPIEVDNIPIGYSLKTFPDKITVKYNVAFENYEKMNASLFRAAVDYKKIEPGINKLKVQLVKFPAEIKAVKINPERVEYIIKK